MYWLHDKTYIKNQQPIIITHGQIIAGILQNSLIHAFTVLSQ